ncbi:MAG TPA: ATP-grasp domain-containing protein [Pseudolabrys sp.]|nr:ATP-grasp domain-containing protein [Pseudolabrys sp.]
MNVTEDKIKAQLRGRALPVPRGGAATTPQAAAEIARELGAVVIKALVPIGRRGKAGAVRFAETPAEAEAAARDIIGTTINGFACGAVYVEEKVAIKDELYLSFILEDYPPQVLVSKQGGVEIETAHASNRDIVHALEVNPIKGLPVWSAIDLWERAGVSGKTLAELGKLTADLYSQFVEADATLLELNPIALGADDRLTLVGAMMATEDTMFEGGDDAAAGSLNERERRVIEANRNLPGGMIRYTELDGDIGLFVGGGGAGLTQHDLILAAGGHPANHTDASTVNPDKVRVLIDAILDNPRVKSLFVSWHYQQMARIDRRVIPVIDALKARKVDLEKFPVVIRMFGPGEEEARKAAAELPGIHYMPHGAPLSDGVRLIVELTEKAKRLAQVQ